MGRELGMINIGVRVQLTGQWTGLSPEWAGLSPEDRMHLLRPVLIAILDGQLQDEEGWLGDWVQFRGITFGSPECLRNFLDTQRCCYGPQPGCVTDE